MTSPLIDVATLAAWQAEARPLVILDARARLADEDAGHALWLERHIPGARHADMDRHLSALPSADGGRHPLPTEQTFAAQLRSWGITPDHQVVVYDDAGGRIAAARAWWMLRWAGHPATWVLDGGWQAWQDAGHTTESGDSTRSDQASDWQPVFNPALIAETDDVERGHAVLLDARAPERFTGEYEPLDRVGGHIPGARNLAGSQLMDNDQRLRSAAQLNTLLPRAERTIAYCGSGISACQIILAYAIAGQPWPRLYPGSWSAWSHNPARAVETGMPSGTPRHEA